MTTIPYIILASQSPRRKQLLEWAEVPFEIIVHPTEETFPPNMVSAEVPIHIALQKALVVEEKLKGTTKSSIPILAADTVVVLNNRIIGKPIDRFDAIETLSALSGKTHQVITGVVILYGNNKIQFNDITEVSFHELSKTEIEFYVDKYQPFDKAGSYAIQEWIGVVGIKNIVGDFYNVMGLPVSRVVQCLKELQINQ